MFRFITSLFAADAPAARRTPANAFRPQLTGMEERYTPAALTLSAPTGTRTALVSTTTAVPGTYVPGTGDIPGTGDYSGVTRGITAVGG